MIIKSELRDIIETTLREHLEDTEVSDDVLDITEDILDKIEDRFPVEDDEEVEEDDE